MHNLFVLEEFTSCDGYLPVIADTAYYGSVLSALVIISTMNPVTSILAMISLFSFMSCYLFIIGLSFISLSYMLVYVGAVSILFIFIVMLISIKTSELRIETKNSIPLAILIGIIFISTVHKVIPIGITPINVYRININNHIRDAIDNNYSDYHELSRVIEKKDEIIFATGKTWDANLAETTHIETIGNIMYTNYPI